MKSKKEQWDLINMRRLPGCTILELQTMAKEGLLNINDPSNEVQNIGDVLEHVSEKDLEAFKECFLYFDHTGEGHVRKEDFGMALRAAGLVITNKEAQALAEKYDLERTGNLDLKAYLCAITENAGTRDTTEEDIRKAFAVFDKKGDGIISAKELTHVLSRIGDSLNEEEVNGLVSALNIHNDGFIRMDELVKLLSIKNTEIIYDI